MFKTDLSLSSTFKKLVREEGWRFMIRYVGDDCVFELAFCLFKVIELYICMYVH